MITKNMKEFKKVSYFSLTLFSTALSLATQASNFPTKDYVDQPIVSKSIKTAPQKESFLDSLKKKFNLVVQRDVESPPMDHPRQSYRDYHNSVVDKYAKKNPDFARHRLPSKEEKKNSSLVSASKGFLQNARELKEAKELEAKKIQKFGEAIVETTVYGSKAIVNNKVKDTEIRNYLLNVLDKAKEHVLNLFPE